MEHSPRISLHFKCESPDRGEPPPAQKTPCEFGRRPEICGKSGHFQAGQEEIGSVCDFCCMVVTGYIRSLLIKYNTGYTIDTDTD